MVFHEEALYQVYLPLLTFLPFSVSLCLSLSVSVSLSLTLRACLVYLWVFVVVSPHFLFCVSSNLLTDPNLADCRKEADVVFVVDSSSNLLYRDFRKYILETIVDIIRRLTVDSGRTRVAAVQFTNTAKVRLRRVSSVN